MSLVSYVFKGSPKHCEATSKMYEQYEHRLKYKEWITTYKLYIGSCINKCHGSAKL